MIGIRSKHLCEISVYRNTPPLKERHDHAFEEGLDLLTDRRRARYDHEGEQAGNDCVFDRGRAAAVARERAQSRSRSMGTSGKSAAGMGYSPMSFGRTHLIAACSSACGVPSQRRHT